MTASQHSVCVVLIHRSTTMRSVLIHRSTRLCRVGTPAIWSVFRCAAIHRVDASVFILCIGVEPNSSSFPWDRSSSHQSSCVVHHGNPYRLICLHRFLRVASSSSDFIGSKPIHSLRVCGLLPPCSLPPALDSSLFLWLNRHGADRSFASSFSSAWSRSIL